MFSSVTCAYSMCLCVLPGSHRSLSGFFDHFPQQEATSTAFEQQHPEAFLLQNKNTLLLAGHYVKERYERVQAVPLDGRTTERQVVTPL